MMTVLRRLVSILGWLVRRRRAEEHLDDEIRSFVEMSAAEKIRDGMSPAQARRLALAEIGGVESVKERVRGGRHGALLDEIGRDVRYACRSFARNPGFTAAVLLTLALGIGANTAIFSLLDALMLRWLPVSRPNELVLLRRAEDRFGEAFSYAMVRALDAQRQIFDGVGGFSGFPFEVGPNGSVERVPGALVTGSFFETLGLQPAAGRLLTRQDDEPGAIPAAVVSYGYWERQLGRRADVVGQILRLHATPVAIVGVAPRGFEGAQVGSIADIMLPVAVLPQVNPSSASLIGPGNFWIRAFARPRSGVSVPQATARVNAVWPQIAESVIAPHWPANRRKAMAAALFELVPGGTGYSYLREIYRRPLLVLMAVAAIVLLIASANVASLLLARATTRRKEVAVRLAIGAGRGRIVRQMLIESTLLSLVGAACGVALAWASSRALLGIISTGITFDLTPNWHVLAFTTGVAVLTGLLFGAAPALQAAAPATASSLSGNTKTHRPRPRLLPALVTIQVALSLVLLAGAGLFVRTLQNLQNVDSGFGSEGVLLVDLEGRRSAAPRALVDDIRRIPGVTSASLTTHTPLSGALWSEPALPAGQTLPEGRDTALFVGAGSGFLQTMQIPLLAGREFTDRDALESPPVALVNEEYARRHFATQQPIGQRLSAIVRGTRRELEIVGLVRNTSVVGLRQTPPATVYVPYAQLTGDFPTTIAIRASGSLAQTTATIQQLVRARVPGSPIDVRPLSAQVQASMMQERLMATLAGAFGGLALTLVCVGLYGLLAYGVVQRTKEIGIRVALGARVTKVVGLVLRDGAVLVIVGLILGLPAAWAASRLVESMLFGLTATDVPTIAGAMALLFAAGQLAALLPARRAARVNPLVALRHE
jgi:predicted permease